MMTYNVTNKTTQVILNETPPNINRTFFKGFLFLLGGCVGVVGLVGGGFGGLFWCVIYVGLPLHKSCYKMIAWI